MNLHLGYFFFLFPAMLIAQYDFRTDTVFSVRSTPYSVYELTQDQISRLPVRGLAEYLQLFNGVIIQDGNVHVRGGRSGETGYYVNGLSTVNPLDNSNAIYIIPEAIEQIRLYPGVYSARYGGANSGVVLTDLKRGTEDFRFSLNVQTDKFAPAGEKFLGTYSYRDQIVTAIASGPVYFDNLRFFVAVENSGIGDNVKRFGYGFEIEKLVDRNYSNIQTITNPDTISLIYPSGFTPFNSKNRWAVNSVLTYELDPVSLQVTLLYNREKVYENDVPVMSILNSRQQYMQYGKLLLSADFNHRLAENLNYSIGITSLVDDAERYDDWFGNGWQAWDDSTLISNYTDERVTYPRKFYEPYPFEFQGFSFYRNGQTLENYLKTSCRYTDIHAAVDWQINARVNLQAGLFRREYTFRRFAVQQSGYMQELVNDSDQARLWERTDNIYGYDIHGRELDTGFDGPRKPVFAGAYSEMRWQSKNVRLNAGLRLDYFDTADRNLKYPLNDCIVEQGYRVMISKDAWREKKAELITSPRIGFIAQTSDQTQFFSNYAKTAQAPSFEYIYHNSYAINRQLNGGYYYLHPYGFDMSTIKSSHFDFGIRHRFTENTHFTLTGFYKNTTGQARVKTLFWRYPSRTLIGDIYDRKFFILSNGDESTSRGLELDLSAVLQSGLHARISYTYTSAEGTGSNAYSNYISVYREPVKYDTTVFAYAPLDFEVKHNFLLSMTYFFPQGKGGIFFENSVWSLLLRMKSGHPYTNIFSYYRAYLAEWSADYELDRRSNEPLEPVNASTTPWVQTVDLGIEKSFKLFADTRAAVFVHITNLFNTKNVINVYTASNAADSDGFLSNAEKERYKTWMGEQFFDLYDAVNLKNGQSYWMATGKQLYGHPRQILFGLRIEY